MLQKTGRSDYQPTLLQVEDEVNQYLKYTMLEYMNTLGRMLSRKQLPMFYFTEAAAELGIPARTCRSWKLNAWPNTTGRGEDRLTHWTAIYLQVYLRLKDYPERETYGQAIIRLQARVNQLKESGYSHNLLSQYLKVSFRTLKDILAQPPGEDSRRSQCPWALLAALERAEAALEQQRERQKELQSRQIRHEEANRREAEPELGPPDDRNRIQPGDPCVKCRQPHSNLKRDGQDAWGRTVLTCIMCGSHNVLAPAPMETPEADAEPPEAGEFLARYDPCRHCNAPWHNLKREGTDPWRNTVYLCLRCAGVNRVKPPPRRVRAG